MLLKPDADAKPVADKPAPPNWGKDALTEYLEKAYRNRWATYANKREWFGRLQHIDRCFMTVLDKWMNPKDPLTPFFMHRSHAAFRAAVEHAAAGQVADVFPAARVCLEFAAYGLHVKTTPQLGETWLSRHDDAKSMAAVKSEFTVRNVRGTIEKAEKHTAEVFNTLYHRAIDFGGHPNERAVTSNMKVEKKEHHTEYLQVYLHTDGGQLDFALKTTAQVGVCALEICQLMFPERFELLGVRHEILELRKGL